MAKNSNESSSSRPFILLLAGIAVIFWFNSTNVPSTPPGQITDLVTIYYLNTLTALFLGIMLKFISNPKLYHPPLPLPHTLSKGIGRIRKANQSVGI
jgi:hypothetical protein